MRRIAIIFTILFSVLCIVTCEPIPTVLKEQEIKSLPVASSFGKQLEADVNHDVDLINTANLYLDGDGEGVLGKTLLTEEEHKRSPRQVVVASPFPYVYPYPSYYTKRVYVQVRPKYYTAVTYPILGL